MIGSLPNELENGEDVKVKGVRKVGGAEKGSKKDYRQLVGTLFIK